MKEYKEYLTAKGYTTESTRNMIRNATLFIEWMKKQNLEITTLHYNDITAFIKLNQQRNIKPRTLQVILTNVKSYLNYLAQKGTIPHNPAQALNIKNAKRKTVYNILSPEELATIYKNYPSKIAAGRASPPQALNKLARKRNKALLSLLIYQGLSSDDIIRLEVNHLELREGKINVPGAKRSNPRTLKLEPHQIFELYDYINETRKQILTHAKKQSNKLFISVGSGSSLNNTLQRIVKELIKGTPPIENIYHIRASVITNWLKQYNKRKVQYMAGHRYVSSTEKYEASNVEALQEDVEKFYPSLS